MHPAHCYAKILFSVTAWITALPVVPTPIIFDKIPVTYYNNLKLRKYTRQSQVLAPLRYPTFMLLDLYSSFYLSPCELDEACRTQEELKRSIADFAATTSNI